MPDVAYSFPIGVMTAMQASQPNFSDILAAIENSKQDIYNKFDKVKTQLTKDLEFKKEGNKEQYKFTTDINACFEEVESLVEQASQKEEADKKQEVLQKVKKVLDEGKQLVSSRQKLIRLADRSELGWLVVKEYSKDKLAEDSEDEKRILAAERRASAKKKKVVKPRKSFFQPYPSNTDRQSGWGGNRNAGNFDNRVCYACGMRGHIRTNCRNVVPTANGGSGVQNPKQTWNRGGQQE